MGQLSLGVVSRSRKEDERRLAIHPLHVERIDTDLRAAPLPGARLRRALRRARPAAGAAGGRAPDPRPAARRLRCRPAAQAAAARTSSRCGSGQVLWGWPHCVQDQEITQLGIDRRLTLIAFEAMNYWSDDGSFSLHVFHKNNELAGYCSVLQALELIGVTGEYGRRLRAAVIGFGAAGRGAVTALNAHGINDVDLLTTGTSTRSPRRSTRRAWCGSSRTPATRAAAWRWARTARCRWRRSWASTTSWSTACCRTPTRRSCSSPAATWARSRAAASSSTSRATRAWASAGPAPTSFAEPMLTVGDNVSYYAVDHSPSLLWNSATWEISEALLPHLRPVLAGPAAWAAEPDHPAGHRDPRRRHPESAHPVVPAPVAGLSAPPPVAPAARADPACRQRGGPGQGHRDGRRG